MTDALCSLPPVSGWLSGGVKPLGRHRRSGIGPNRALPARQAASASRACSSLGSLISNRRCIGGPPSSQKVRRKGYSPDATKTRRLAESLRTEAVSRRRRRTPPAPRLTARAASRRPAGTRAAGAPPSPPPCPPWAEPGPEAATHRKSGAL